MGNSSEASHTWTVWPEQPGQYMLHELCTSGNTSRVLSGILSLGRDDSECDVATGYGSCRHSLQYVSLKLIPQFGCLSEMRLWCVSTANRKASSTNQKTSSENQKVFLKKRKASSNECWVRTHTSFRNAVQLRLCIFCVRV